jgi:hypothetical protein
MRRFLNKLASGFHSTSKARSARRAPRRASLQVESLERREVLSVSSPSIHAVADGPASNPTLERVFYINKSDHALYTATGGTTGTLTPWILTGWSHAPSSVQTLSAGHGANGDADVVIEAADGSLWEDTISGTDNIGQMLNWKELLGPGQVKSFAAVDGGRVFAIFSDSTLHQFGGASWSVVPTPGTVKAIDAITDKFGHDTVYVLNGDNSFGEVTYLPPQNLPGPMVRAAAKATTVIMGPGGVGGVSLQAHYAQLAAAGHIVFHGQVVGSFPTVNKFSAGTDANGYADVFATWWTGGLYRNVGNTAGGWSLFAAPGSFTDYNAIDQGQVWINSAAGAITLYTAPGTPATAPSGGGGNTAVSVPGPNIALSGVGAGGGYAWGVFFVDASGRLWYYVDNLSHGSPNYGYSVGGTGAFVYPYLG